MISCVSHTKSEDMCIMSVQIWYNTTLLYVWHILEQLRYYRIFNIFREKNSCRVCCTRMYWNSSTGESAPVATAMPSKRRCFLVMRRSLFLMAATILSSEPWWVLIEYKWQPGTKTEGGRDRQTDNTLDVCCAIDVVPWHHPTDQCIHHRERLAWLQQQVKGCVFALPKGRS